MRARLLTTALIAPFVLAAPAHGLAGGSTGSGGGGGGGGGSSGGGYGGSGGSGEWDTTSWIIFIAIMALSFGGPVLIAMINKGRRAWVRERILRRARKVEKEAGAANLDDGYWDPVQLKERVKEAFFPIQMSWERRDVQASRPYVSDALFERHRLQLEGYEKQNRVNRIKDLKLHDIQLVRLHNVTQDGEDRFVAYIKCSARDWMEDTKTGKFVNGNKQSSTDFEQYWSFVRDPRFGWVLDEIQQGEEAEYHLEAQIVNQDDGPRIYEQQDPAPGPASA